MSPVEAQALESQLEHDRAALSRSLEELGQLARERADPREQVRNRPLAWLAGALLVGFWWGSSR